MDPLLKSKLQQQVQRNFLEFLENFRQKKEGTEEYEPDLYYVEQAKAMIRENRRTLYVRVRHLAEISPDVLSYQPGDLYTVIESKYMMVRDALNAAVPQLLGKLDDKDLQEEVQKARETDELKFTASFYDMPYYSGIRDLRTEKLGRLTTICGTVTRITEVKPELLVGTFQCMNCNAEISGVTQQFKVTQPAICRNRACGNRLMWELLPHGRTTRWGDWQRLRVQENENEVPAGSMPRSIDVIVRDESCERCKAGDKVLITGSLIVVPDVPTMMSPSELKQQVRRTLTARSEAAGAIEGIRGLKGLGNRDLTYKLAFFGVFLSEDSAWSSQNRGGGENVRSDDRLYLSQGDKERFEQISSRPDCFDMLARCIAPSVCGHLEVKKGILLMLIGGLIKKTQEGIKLRGDINVCLLGDPATAKSAMLKWTAQFLPRAVFASGKSSTAAGLTASVTRDMDLDQEKVIEPGALMLADNGVCCIDEFERMDEKDMVAIHEAMEQQTITLAKAGIKATLNARASILASCLPTNTYYNPAMPLHKNCNLSPPIVSRFDLMFIMQDMHDETNDERVARHILAISRQQDEDIAPELPQCDLQRYIRLARTINPKVTNEAKEVLVRCYKRLREERQARGPLGITVRQLESLVRLSEAIARVHLDEKIKPEYVTEAFDLQVNSLRRAGRENIDLNPDYTEPADAEEPTAPDAPAAEASAPAWRPRKVKISYAEYQRIGKMLCRHLVEQSRASIEVREEDLVTWYMEQVEKDIQTEAQLFDQQHMVQLVVNRLINKDRVIIVLKASDDPQRPEMRILGKHPNFPIDEEIAESTARPA